MNKYTRTIHPASQEGAFPPIEVDVYSVLTAFNVTNPAVQHAVKKLLCAGERGSNSVVQDLEESIQAVQRAVTLVKQSPPYVCERVLDAMKADSREEKRREERLEAATRPPELHPTAPASKAAKPAEYQRAYRQRKKARK